MSHIGPGDSRSGSLLRAIGYLLAPAIFIGGRSDCRAQSPGAKDSSALSAVARPSRALPIVLFVHGRGQQKKDNNAIRRDWLRGLVAGQAGIGASELIPPENIRFAFYQRYFRGTNSDAAPTCACGEPAPSDTAAVRLAAEVRSDSIQRPRAKPLNALLVAFRDGTYLIPTVSQKLFLKFFVRDTRDWLLKDRAYMDTRLMLDSVFASVPGRPVIIVAHSMGGLVMYDYLLRNPDVASRVARFITIGTQIGDGRLLRILDEPDSVPHTHPAVGDWVNLRDYEDPLGFSLYESDGRAKITSGDRTGRPPTELAILTGSKYHHQLDAYLAHSLVARSISAAWCNSAPEGGKACLGAAGRDVLFERSDAYRQSKTKRSQHLFKYVWWSSGGAWLGRTVLPDSDRRIGALKGALAGGLLTYAFEAVRR